MSKYGLLQWWEKPPISPFFGPWWENPPKMYTNGDNGGNIHPIFFPRLNKGIIELFRLANPPK